MTKVKVVFSLDPSGFDKDIVEEIILMSNLCIYCYLDSSKGLVEEVEESLIDKGYKLDKFFQLLKITLI